MSSTGLGPNWDLVSGHDTLDEFWRALRYDDRYDQIDVPCLHVTGWYDLEDLLGAFHHYEHMRDMSPARDAQYLLVGPWSHVKSRYPDRECGGLDFGPEAAYDMDAEHLRWFDYWLKGIDTGVQDLDRVRVFEPGRNVWRGAAVVAAQQLGPLAVPGPWFTRPRATGSALIGRVPVRPAPTQHYGDGRAQVPVRGRPDGTNRK